MMEMPARDRIAAACPQAEIEASKAKYDAANERVVAVRAAG
jgi:hypothetical protein